MPADDDVATAQYALACRRANVDQEMMAACVAKWMDEKPLTLLRRFFAQEHSSCCRRAARGACG